jgi:hypothetical protein
MSAWVGRQTRPRLALEVGFRGLAVGEQQCEYQSPIPVTECDLLIVICDCVHVKGPQDIQLLVSRGRFIPDAVPSWSTQRQSIQILANKRISLTSRNEL